MWGKVMIASKEEEMNRRECTDAVFLQVISSSVACAAFGVHTMIRFPSLYLELALYLATNRYKDQSVPH